MATTTSGAIHFSGLGNGVDFSSIIDAVIEADSYQINRLTTWKQEWTDKQDSLNELNTQLLSLETTLKSLDTMDEFMVNDAESSDTDLITAKATSQADEGSYQLEVNQLAQSDVWVSDTGESSTTTDITGSTSQTFSFTYSNANISLSVAAGTTLQGLVNQINNSSTASECVRASVLYDGSTYHLQLTGRDQGEDHAVTLTGSGFGNYTPDSFTNTRTAQNAQIRLDGYPTDSWLERGSNSVSDVIDGVTLTLRKTTDGDPVTISVTTDTDSIKENIQTFVDQFNEVLSMVQDMTKVDTSGSSTTSSILTGNYGVQDLIGGRLKNMIADLGLGFNFYDSTTGTGDRYSTLAQIGVLTDSDQSSDTAGLLTIDEDTLDDALEDDPSAVAELFSATNVGSTNTANFSYTSSVEGITKPGTYKVEYVLWPGGVDSATINGHKATISADGRTITGAAGYDEAGLSITVTNLSGFRGSGTVSLKQGKVGELIDALKEMTNTTDGPLHILDDNYQDIVDNIDTKIANEETRLELKKQRLTTQYAKLDALLGEYQNLQTSLESQIAQLSSD